MILSDRTIQKKLDTDQLVITPLHPDDIQPASVDLHLEPAIRIFNNSELTYIDIKQNIEDATTLIEMPDQNSPYMLQPGEFILGSTIEHIELPDNLVARLEGKSSLGRIGLVIHSTAGFIDPGFKGNITLELSNLSNLPITLYPNMKIAQISFMTMTTPARRIYGSPELHSRYQGQKGPTASRYHQDYQKDKHQS